MTEAKTTEMVKTEDVMATFDKLDESQALAELKGAELQEYVYSFADKGVTVTGLSLVGVRETAREMNKRGLAKIGISDKLPEKIETDEYIEVWAYARDELNGGGWWGSKRQDKRFATGTENRFCLEQALSKSQRNAVRGLIPETFVKEMIKHYTGIGKARVVTTDEVQAATSKGKGKFPTNREYWEKYDWSKKDMAKKPAKMKGKKQSMEALKIYFYATDLMPKDQIEAFFDNLVGKKTWSMTYEDIKKVVEALQELDQSLQEEGEQLQNVTDEELGIK